MHACVCRWDFCPPSRLPTETNQAESCQAAGLVGTESLAELLALRICSFKVSLTSHKPHFSPEMYYILRYSRQLGLKCFDPLQSPMLPVKMCTLWGSFIQRGFRNKTHANTHNTQYIPTTKSHDFYVVKRQFRSPESLIQRLTGHLHIMEIWFNLLQHTGLIATDSDASKPKGCCTSSLTAELEAAHRQYFYP